MKEFIQCSIILINNAGFQLGREPSSSTQTTFASSGGILVFTRKTPATEEKVDQALIKRIVEGMHTFSEIEKPSFINMWSTLTDQKVMSRHSLMKKIDLSHENMLTKIISTLCSVSEVCLTIDCWTAHHKSYMGITCSWICPTSLERINIALSCKRIIGTHTYDVLAKAIFEVLLQFKIQNKESLCVTNSGSNFITAFKSFRVVGTDSINPEAESMSDDDEAHENV